MYNRKALTKPHRMPLFDAGKDTRLIDMKKDISTFTKSIVFSEHCGKTIGCLHHYTYLYIKTQLILKLHTLTWCCNGTYYKYV